MEEPGLRLRACLASEPERLLAVHLGETFHVPLETRFNGPLQPDLRQVG